MRWKSTLEWRAKGHDRTPRLYGPEWRRCKAPLPLRFGAFMGRRLNFSAGREYAFCLFLTITLPSSASSSQSLGTPCLGHHPPAHGAAPWSSRPRRSYSCLSYPGQACESGHQTGCQRWYSQPGEETGSDLHLPQPAAGDRGRQVHSTSCAWGHPHGVKRVFRGGRFSSRGWGPRQGGTPSPTLSPAQSGCVKANCNWFKEHSGEYPTWLGQAPAENEPHWESFQICFQLQYRATHRVNSANRWKLKWN